MRTKLKNLTADEIAVLDGVMTNRQVAAALEIGVGTVSDWRQLRGHANTRVNQKEVAQDVRAGDEDSFKDAGKTLEAKRTVNKRVTTLAELLSVCGVDGNEWTVERWSCKAWEGFSKDNLGNAKITDTMFSVSATFKRNPSFAVVTNYVDDLVESMKSHAPAYAPAFYPPRSTPGYLCECACYDLHLGKLSWDEESGRNYDLRIAEQRYEDALTDIINSASAYNIERFCLPIGHDFFQVDGRENKTAHGTVVTTDSRQQKVFRVGREVIVRGIDRLRLIAPVDVVMVPGNHDLESNFSLGEVLQAWYRNDSCVSVDNRATVRKYYEYGKVMLQLTHGSEETTSVKCAELAAAEQPEMWGRTVYRESHQGHRHMKRGSVQKVQYTEEYGERLGFITRIISALSETDDWHFGKAYVQNLQGAESFIWSAEQGLKSHQFYTVPV